MPEQWLAAIILPLSAETQVVSRYFCTVPPSSACHTLLPSHDQTLTRALQASLRVQGRGWQQALHARRPPYASQNGQAGTCTGITAVELPLQAHHHRSSNKSTKVPLYCVQTKRGSDLPLSGRCSEDTLHAPVDYSVTVEQRQVI